MKQIEHVTLIDMGLDIGAGKLPLGRLGWRTGKRRGYFVHSEPAVEAKLALSSFDLPLN